MPGTTNFLDWDAPLNNIESDSAYLAETLRVNGITAGAILPSIVLNKGYRQWSTFVAAFCQMMATKGFNTSDENTAALAAVLANVKTTADFPNSIQTVAYATSIAFNVAAGAAMDLTLTGNVTGSTITGFVAGSQILFLIAQDATGGRTFSWPSSITAPGTICSLANSVSIQAFEVRADGSTILPTGPMLWVGSSGIIAQTGAHVVPISASGSVSSGYSEIVEKVNASSGAITRTLYQSSSAPNGFKVNIKKIDSSTNPVIPTAFSGDNIDGFSSLAIYPQYASYTFVSDGTGNWSII